MKRDQKDANDKLILYHYLFVYGTQFPQFIGRIYPVFILISGGDMFCGKHLCLFVRQFFLVAIISALWRPSLIYGSNDVITSNCC